MRNFVFVFNFLLVCLSPAIVAAQGIKFFSGTWAEAKAKAKQENKPIFVDVYAVWCGPCKYMTNSVFTQKSVGDYFNANFISLKIDAEKGDGIDFAQTYRVGAYPTLMYFNPKGELIAKEVGALSAEELIDKGRKHLGQKSTEEEFIEEFRAGKLSTEAMQTFLVASFEQGDQALIEELAPIFWSKLTQEEKLKEDNFTTILLPVYNHQSPIFQDIIKHRKEYEKNIDPEAIDAFALIVFSYELNDLVERAKTDPKINAAAFTASVKKYVPSQEAFFHAQANYYLAFVQERPAQEIHSRRIAYLSQHCKNADELRNEAWAIVEANSPKGDYANALVWINRAIEIQPHYSYTAVKAWIMFRSNQKEEAKKLANQSLKESENEDTNNEIAHQLLEELK